LTIDLQVDLPADESLNEAMPELRQREALPSVKRLFSLFRDAVQDENVQIVVRLPNEGRIATPLVVAHSQSNFRSSAYRGSGSTAAYHAKLLGSLGRFESRVSGRHRRKEICWRTQGRDKEKEETTL